MPKACTRCEPQASPRHVIIRGTSLPYLTLPYATLRYLPSLRAADADQVEAGIAAEVDEQAAADSAWSARRFDSLFHLDGAVAMLTLGNQGIVREVARASLQPAAVAAAFTLAPRLVDPVDAVNSVSPAAEELTAAQVDSSGVEDDALRLRDEAVDAVRDADVSTGGEQLCPLCDDEGGGKDSPMRMPMIPRVRADRQALGELPGARAAEFEAQLVAGCLARQQYLANVLDAHGWPDEHRDPANILCGVKGIAFSRGMDGDEQRWKVGGTRGDTFSTLADALRSVSVDSLFGSRTEQHRDAEEQALALDPAEAAEADGGADAFARLSSELLQATVVSQPQEALTSAHPEGIDVQGDQATSLHAVVPAWPLARSLGTSLPAALMPSETDVTMEARASTTGCGLPVATVVSARWPAAKLSRAARPSGAQVTSYLTYFGDGSAEVDALHALLSDAVLDVYVDWHILPGGRLASQCPAGASRDALRGTKCASYRVPFDSLVATARYAAEHSKEMRTSAAVCIPDWGGHRKRANSDGKVLSVSLFTKMMVGLREWPGCAVVADNELVQSAYAQSLHELNQNVGMNAQPLDRTLQTAILRQCGDLSSLADVRQATWTVVSPLLMQRTCESLSLLHGDLQIEPGEASGSWYVPGFTKTTDGVEGRVPLWAHRCGCKLAACKLHEALELPVEELRAAACSLGADGRLDWHSACAVCLVWLSRRLQGLSAVAADGAHPLYQEISSDGTCFTGRLVDPDVLLAGLRQKMTAADAQRALLGFRAFPLEGRVFYMARHGGIMQALMDGFTVEWVAEKARIPVSTLLRFYRRHNVIDDAFESNGLFSLSMVAAVIAHARSDGFLAKHADIELLLASCELTLDAALGLSRPELFARIAPSVAADVRHVAAAGALLRSASVRSSLIAHPPSLIELSEDDELSPEALRDFLVEASHRVHDDQRQICMELEAAEVGSLEAATVRSRALMAGSSTSTTGGSTTVAAPLAVDGTQSASHNDCESLPDAWKTLAAKDVHLSHILDEVAERRLLLAAPTLPIFSEYLSDAWRVLAARDGRVRSLFDEVAERGLRVSSPPPAEALLVGTHAGRLLPRVLAYRWQGDGWLLGEIVACNDNPHALHGGQPINFIVTYSSDDGAGERAEHALRLEDYAKTTINGWLLFEAEQGAAASELPVETLQSTRGSRKARSAVAEDRGCLALARPHRSTAAATRAKIASSSLDDQISINRRFCNPQLRPSAEPAVAVSALAAVACPSNSERACRAGSGAPSRDQPLASCRPRAIFARASLHGVVLPPMPLLLCDTTESHAAVAARLEEQSILTGCGHDELCKRMRKVQQLDLFLQAASGGQAGLYGDEVGGQLWTLSAKPSYLAIIFLDMAREHGKGKMGRLAFARGGYQSLIRANMTCADATSLIEALGLTSLDSDEARRQAAVDLNGARGDDDRILAGKAVLNGVFALIVRQDHTEDGVFAHGLSAEELDWGVGRLHVGALLVKQLGIYFACGLARHRLTTAKPDELVGGKLREGPHARDESGKVRKYSGSTINGFKSVLGWWLRRQGWKSIRMRVKGVPNASYLSVEELESRLVRKAYFTTVRMCINQRVFRAMAATEDVMQALLAVLCVVIAKDLTMVVAMCVAYGLGLRVSDTHLLNRSNFRYGRTERRADVEFVADRHKGDGQGQGFSRWLQHCHGCEFEYRSAAGNADGRGWSMMSAAGYQWKTSVTPGQRCPVCLLLMLLSMQGDAPVDAPLFRRLVKGAKWGWKNGEAGCAAHFTSERLQYWKYNEWLHQLLIQVNDWREDRGLAHWPRSDFHWHMFRHGHVIMALIYKTPQAEIQRSLRMNPETLQSYCAHVVGALGALFDGAQTHEGVQQRAWAVELDRLAEAVVGRGDACGALRSELQRLCDIIQVSPTALRRAKPCLRQLIVHGAAMRHILSVRFATPLLDELRKADLPSTSSTAAALPSTSSTSDPAVLELSTLVDEVTDPEALAAPQVDDAARTVDEPVDGIDDEATQVGDDTTQVAVAELQDMWQSLRAEALAEARSACV